MSDTEDQDPHQPDTEQSTELAQIRVSVWIPKAMIPLLQILRACRSALSAFLLNTAEFLAEIPKTGTRFLKAFSKAADPDFDRAVNEGEVRADQAEDQAIAQNEETRKTTTAPSEHELQAKIDDLLTQFDELRADVAARGHSLPIIDLPNNAIAIIAVPEALQRMALESIKRELLQFNNRDRTPVESLGLPQKALAALKEVGIIHLSDIENFSEEELDGLSGIGPKTLDKLRSYLRQD